MHLRPLEQKDLYDFSRVVGLAMWEDEIMHVAAPHRDQYPSSYYRHVLHRVRVRFYRGESMFLAVTDENDKDWTGCEQVIGYCSYSTNVPGHQKPVRSGWLGNWFEQWVVAATGGYAKLLRLDRSANRAAEDKFRSLAEMPDKWRAQMPSWFQREKDGQHWELEVLGTHPDFRRRGVGKLMLQWGFEQATRDCVPLLLLSSVAGEKLYRSAGFQEFDRIGMRLDPEQPEQEFSWPAMIWKPVSLQEDGI